MEGVEACSVANRSGVGLEAAGMLQPAVSAKMSNVKMNLVLYTFSLDGFKVTLLACQGPRNWGMLFLSIRNFSEASHALQFSRYKTDAGLCMFRRRHFVQTMSRILIDPKY